MTDLDWLSMLSGTATAFTALVFARAAVHKLWDFTSFTGFVDDYQLVPEPLVKPVSAAVAGLETLIIALLLVPGARVLGLLLAVALYAAYAAAMAINIHRGRTHIECGCGGPVQPINAATLARNGGLALIAIAGLFGAGQPLDIGQAFTAIAGGATVFIGFLLVEQIISNASILRIRH